MSGQASDSGPRKHEGVDIRTFTAADISSFTAAVVSACQRFDDARPWWRGQRDANWPLVAGLYRNGLDRNEHNLNARFRLMAKSRRGNCPASYDPLGWLFLMQHYRLPTRLLDWTQSPLVALFFALEEPDNQDAVVWALSPTHLNAIEARAASIFMPGSPPIARLGSEAFRQVEKERDQRVLSVLTDEADVRHMVQQSVSTIHGRAEPLDLMPGCGRFLTRVRIPSAAKRGLRQVLALFGVNRASLFPDLENLSAELAGLQFSDPLSVEKVVGDPQGEPTMGLPADS